MVPLRHFVEITPALLALPDSLHTLGRAEAQRALIFSPGVANFGENPATGRVEARLEVYLFDFDEDLYGQTIETELIAFLRPEMDFDSLEALVAQIAADAAAARDVLGL